MNSRELTARQGVDRVVCIWLPVDIETPSPEPEVRHVHRHFLLPVLCLTVTGNVSAHKMQQHSVRAEQSTPAATAFRWTVQVPERNWKFVVIHHSATTRGSVESIDRNHRSRRDSNGNPWLGIGYHFVIGNGNGMADGRISPTFRWKQQLHGAHSGSIRHNARGIGICLIGNFEETAPTAAQHEAVTSLIRTLTTRYGIPADGVKGHSQIRATACPGRYFPFRQIVNESVPGGVSRRSGPALVGRDFN